MGERLGPRAGKNLQVLVHRLRRTLDAPERIRHDRSGYTLSARPEEVDAWHFADLAEHARRTLNQGELEAASVLQREALALWNGRAFSGLDGVAQLAEAAERLEQNRRRVLTERIDTDLALGRHAEVIPELISMVAEDPLVESTTARLMVAMHRSGCVRRRWRPTGAPAPSWPRSWGWNRDRSCARWNRPSCAGTPGSAWIPGRKRRHR